MAKNYFGDVIDIPWSFLCVKNTEKIYFCDHVFMYIYFKRNESD